jgi:hypothetical protein
VPRPHQKPEGNLRCVECGREQPSGEPGWKAYLTVDDNFIAMCEAPPLYPKLDDEHQRLLRISFDSVLRYYRSERASGSNAVEVSPFFKRADVHKGYEVFWPGAANATLRKRFERSAPRFRALLKDPK